MNKQLPAQTTELSYFEKRMRLLGITPDLNKISIHQTELQTGKAVMNDLPIFKETDKGIRILVYTLDRLTIRIERNGSRMKEDFAMTRLSDPIIKPNGDVIKYLIPKGAGTQPFFPPQLIEKYEQKIPMKTVFLTEGYFKAFKAAMHGVDIIGLSSITHMKDKVTGALHEDIVRLIKSGLVERFVWLTDGDCLDISSKEITEDKDLFVRPKGFFSSISTFKNLLDDYTDIEKWFMHIDCDGILQDADNKKMNREQVKGLDDLLCSFKGKENEIAEDLQSVSKNGYYFKKFNITSGTGKVWRYFHLTDVNDFFLFQSDRRPELKNKEFKFHGTKYLWNDEKSNCEVRMPGEAELYFRVGDDYYKKIEKPNQHQKIETIFTGRKKSTIVDDHGKNFCKHIPKYEDFCNVPNHSNFEQVIHHCYNVYSPLDFQPDEDKCGPDDFPGILSLVQHIWGDKTVHYTDRETKEKFECKNWELGMDYLQLLYQQPSQKLPILCLVSRENGTGKSTLGFFLRNFLGANVAIVGNADLAGDFNAHWASKSVVICDEAKIDKHQVIEKIKALSTAKKIYMNAKGRGQVELDCFIKFLLITNNEETFITASEEDSRYWVIKVPVLRKDDPRILDKLVEEIPALLSYFNDRKLITEEKSRMWFHFDLLKTDALRKVIAYSESQVVKDIRIGLKELFLDTGYDEILMTVEVLRKELLPAKYERNYVHTVLKDKIKVHQYHVWVVEGVDKEYTTQEEAIAAAEIKFPDHKGHMILGQLKQKFKPKRYTYPSYIEKFENGNKERVRVDAVDNGRPYVFKRKDFVSAEENAQVDIGAAQKFAAEIMSPQIIAASDASLTDELPFG